MVSNKNQYEKFVWILLCRHFGDRVDSDLYRKIKKDGRKEDGIKRVHNYVATFRRKADYINENK